MRKSRMQPYGERIPRVHFIECFCGHCPTWTHIRKRDRKPSKVRERQKGKRVAAEQLA